MMSWCKSYFQANQINRQCWGVKPAINTLQKPFLCYRVTWLPQILSQDGATYQFYVFPKHDYNEFVLNEPIPTDKPTPTLINEY